MKLSESYVNYCEKNVSWEEAINIVTRPMLENNDITTKYVESIKDNIIKNDDYIILVENFALPHSGLCKEVNRNSVSILKTKKSVIFPSGKTVKLFICFAAIDNNAHMKVISDLANILIDKNLLNKFMNSESVSDIRNLIL